MMQKLKNLEVPKGKVDVVLDTDAFNEIDDQYAIAYLLRSGEKLNTKAIYAAPFLNGKVETPAEGMEKSFCEIKNILNLVGESREVFRGSESFLPDENTPVISDAAKDLAARVNDYSPENPLYIVAIGAITNVASAILLNPKVCENAVVIWLGGHSQHYHDNWEFNFRQDIAAVRVVFQSGVPLVQLPCMGVVSAFTLSIPDIEYWLRGKSPLSDYLAEATLSYMKHRGMYSKAIWDVTAVAWLLNDEERFMRSRIITTPIPSYDHRYTCDPNGGLMRYVYHIHKDALVMDMMEKLTK